jgi:hypothetical protein
MFKNLLQPGFAVPVQTGRYTADSGATGGRRYRFAPVRTGRGSNILNLNSKNWKMKQKYLKGCQDL